MNGNGSQTQVAKIAVSENSLYENNLNFSHLKSFEVTSSSNKLKTLTTSSKKIIVDTIENQLKQ